MPPPERENDVGGRFTPCPGSDSQRISRLSAGAVPSYASAARPDVARRADEADTGATPQAEGLVRARAPACFHTLPPPSRGRSRSISPSREGHRAAVPCGDQPSAHRQGGSGGGAPARPLPRQRRGELGVRRGAQHPLGQTAMFNIAVWLSCSKQTRAPTLGNLTGRVAHARGRPRVAGGSGRVGSAAVDPRPLAPPKLTAEGIYALDPRVLWVTQRREARSRRCGLGGQQVWAKMPGHVGLRRHSFEGCRRGRKPDFYIVQTLDAKFTYWAFW